MALAMALALALAMAMAMAMAKKEDEMELEMVINGVAYVPKEKCEKDYKIVRTYSAGVFAGYLESRNGQEVVLRNARRIWYWSGAASLSQLAMEGTTDPKNCKFPIAVDKVELLQVIEILDVTEKAKNSIEGCPVWKM